MFLGSKLKDIREDNNLTQVELAKKLGITQGSLGHYEKGRREPSKNLMTQICKLFRIQEAFFYSNQEVDRVRQRIDELKEQGILKSADDVTGSVSELILEAVRTELRIKELKKEQRD